METEDYSEYPEDTDELKGRLIESDKTVKKLAEIGRDLFEENTDLKSQLEDLRKSCDRKLEQAEQAKYSLQNKLDQKLSSEQWYHEEITSLKQQLQDKQDYLKDTLEAEKAQEVARLSKQIEELKGDLEQASTKETQLNQKVSELEALIQHNMVQAENQSNRSFDKNEDLCELSEENDRLQNEITALKTQLIEKKSEVQMLETERETVRGRLMARDEELEDVRCQFTSVNNALEEARMEKLDLKCQLDALRMETSDHKKKGNSIFSELDDRRVDAEKKVISLQILNKSLQEKYAVEKQQNQTYKRKISQLLLEASSGRVDMEYVADLERKLASARQELKSVMEHQQHHEMTFQNDTKPAENLEQVDKSNNSPVNEDYKEYLITLVKQREDEKEKMGKELHLKTIQLLDEKSKCSSLESQLRSLETDKQKLQSRNMKLGLRVEELQLKYEPDAVKKSGVLTIKRTEKIPLQDPDDIKITETRRAQDTYNNLSKSNMVLNDSTQLQSNLFSTESSPSTAVNLLDCLKKRKTVRISEEVEEHEIENEDIDAKTETGTNSGTKGRLITDVKYVKSDYVNKLQDVNQCKNQ